ncbi:MAG: FHA domain-containing protein [Bacteriovoracaceae bacterium]
MANMDDDGNENENSGATLITKVDDLLIEKTSKTNENSNPNELDFRPYFIQIVSNLGKGTIYKLVNKLEIGSGKGQVLITHPSVSHLHCTITNTDGEITITDHGSTNGTYVGGKKIPPAKKIKINTNDHFLVGQVEFVLLQNDETAIKNLNENTPKSVKAKPASKTTKVREKS